MWVGTCALLMCVEIANSYFLLSSLLKIEVYKPNIVLEHACMHEDNMKKLQGDCVLWLVLLTGAAQLIVVCGVVGTSSPGMFN